MTPGFPGTGKLPRKGVRKNVAHPQNRALVKSLAALAFCFGLLPFIGNAPAGAAPIASHWFYCVETETQKQKDTYFSSTFESSAEQNDLLHDFSLFISKEYDVPAEHLMGSCYAVRRYKPDKFANVEEQRSQHMEQSHQQGQNVIATGWAPK